MLRKEARYVLGGVFLVILIVAAILGFAGVVNDPARIIGVAVFGVLIATFIVAAIIYFAWRRWGNRRGPREPDGHQSRASAVTRKN